MFRGVSGYDQLPSVGVDEAACSTDVYSISGRLFDHLVWLGVRVFSRASLNRLIGFFAIALSEEIEALCYLILWRWLRARLWHPHPWREMYRNRNVFVLRRSEVIFDISWFSDLHCSLLQVLSTWTWSKTFIEMVAKYIAISKSC